MESQVKSTNPVIPWNGCFTIKRIETGEHRTFRIRTQSADAKFAPGKRIVSLLTGPSNENDYQGFGFVADWGIQVWQRHRSDKGKPRTPWEWYADMLISMLREYDGGDVVTGATYRDRRYEIRYEKRCRVCNRTLTTPESIDAGIGPICAGR